jgi:hypothetical protein
VGIGQPCSDDLGCGEGARCLPTPDGDRCAVECATTEGCGGLECSVPAAPGRAAPRAPDEARYCRPPDGDRA